MVRHCAAFIAIFAILVGDSSATAKSKGLAASPKPEAVRVELISYHGWSSAYRLTNGIVDVVVVPQIGRIMAYYLTGHPETNPIWNNSVTAGKPRNLKDGSWSGWMNYGGDKLWPSPEHDWPAYGAGGGPCPSIDTGPYSCSRTKNGITLTGPSSPEYGIQVIRNIALGVGSTKLTLTDKFVKLSKGAADLPVGIWSVTQVSGDGCIALIPLHSAKNGNVADYHASGDAHFRDSNWKPVDGVLTVVRNPLRTTKVVVKESAGWIGCSYGDGLLFLERFTCAPNGPYLDNDSNAQVYTNVKPSYIEMEVHGPGRRLSPGESLTRTLVWSLQRTHVKTPNPSDIRRLIDARRYDL